MSTTAIEWATDVWNPVTGCTKVSPGCKHCYAETVATRFWKGRKFTDVRTHPDRLDAPLRWRKPRRVFVNSMSDLFHEDVPDAFIDSVFGVMGLSATEWCLCRRRDCDHEGFSCEENGARPLKMPNHQFLVLTKRPERMRAYMAVEYRRQRILDAAHRLGWMFGEDMVAELPWPWPNVWLGVSVEDQQRADERIPVLLDTPAAIRFLSIEPLLGPVILSGPGLEVDWAIVGGESGPGARPCDVAWVRSIVAQCQTCQIPVFVKQLGASWYEELALVRGKDRKGGAMEEWPEDLRVREFP